MTMDFQRLLFRIFTEAPPIILAITVHEAAHAYAAYHFGDTTARCAGRLSLNPFRHIDIRGTLLIPAVLLFLGLPAFGWAKPVPVDAYRLGRTKNALLIVAAAGPSSNALMAILWAALFRLTAHSPDSLLFSALKLMALTGIGINLILMTFNLIPLPPLDGGRIVANLLPARSATWFSRIEPFGFVILILLLVSGALDRLLLPLVALQFDFLFRIFNP
jgi:Zn-dependent protease